MLEHKFYINLDKDTDRAIKFKDTDFVRWAAVSREEVTDEVDKKMISFHNFPRQSHLARCGCFSSHLELYIHIVENKLNNVLIVEDDFVQTAPFPTEYPDDSIIYLGGVLANQKITDSSPVKIDFKTGVNRLNPKYRMLMTMSYIIPRWELAKEILDLIFTHKRYRAIDIFLGNISLSRPYYIYPACGEEEGVASTIHKRQKKANNRYRLVKI